MLIHGLKDKVVDKIETMQIAEIFKNKEIILYENGDHALVKVFKQNIRDFIKKVVS